MDQDDVRTKVSGEGARRDAAPVGARDAGPDTIPESSVDSRSAPTSAQLTADASGARLIIPALSLRDAIANGPLFDAPPLDGPPPSPEAIRAANAGVAERLEPTAPVKRRRRRHASLGLWLAASALVGLGLLASTTETADRVAARIQLAFQNDAIPAARADSTGPAPALEAPPAPVETAAVAAEVSAAPAALAPEAKAAGGDKNAKALKVAPKAAPKVAPRR